MKAQGKFRATSEGAPAVGQRAMDAAEDAASRTGDDVQARMTDASAHAQSVARNANDRMEELTGRRLESWTAEARTFIREHPLQAIALTIGIGYVLGKVMARD